MWHDLAQRAGTDWPAIAAVAWIPLAFPAAQWWRRRQVEHRRRDYSGERGGK